VHKASEPAAWSQHQAVAGGDASAKRVMAMPGANGAIGKKPKGKSKAPRSRKRPRRNRSAADRQEM
jgi:hypothetical protein